MVFAMGEEGALKFILHFHNFALPLPCDLFAEFYLTAAIKRELGANPGQSRCCVLLKRCHILLPLKLVSGRRGIKASQKTCKSLIVVQTARTATTTY